MEKIELTQEEYENFKKIEKIYLDEVNKKVKNTPKIINQLIIEYSNSIKTGERIDLSQFNECEMDLLNASLYKSNRRLFNNQIIIIKEFKIDFSSYLHAFLHCKRIDKQNQFQFEHDYNTYIGLYVGTQSLSDDTHLHYFIFMNNNEIYSYTIECPKTKIQIFNVNKTGMSPLQKMNHIVGVGTSYIELDNGDFNILKFNLRKQNNA